MTEWKAAAADKGVKLLEFIKAQIGPKYSSRQLKRWIESNLCTVNGRVERFASALLAEGDIVAFRLPDNEPVQTPGFHPQKEAILFEDAHLFIYNKPAGISCTDSSFLVQLQSLCPGLALIHRLDKETSGAILLAKTESMRQAMIKAFQEKKIEKTYFALVDGIPEKKAGTIKSYLGKVASYQGQSLWGAVPREKGLYAETHWKIRKKGRQASWLECRPITGRTHQIRVHLASLGHPILGDYQYGRTFKSPSQPRRCLLHAFSLSFTHPLSAEAMHIEAPLPKDFTLALQTLDRDPPGHEEIPHY
jgi:RluA family pseudouridine synthase